MSANRKFYVVWVGDRPGIYDSWEECQLQIKGYPGAKFKSFASQEEAVMAYRGNPADHLGVLKAIASHRPEVVNYEAFPEIRLDAIAVDGACSGNPGPMEYRGVEVNTGVELFRVGPFEGGTNNIAEYLAIIHALALLDKQGRHDVPIYSDSLSGRAWVRKRACNSKITPTPQNEPLRQVIARADRWIQTHSPRNPILTWDTDRWGEIPADFGRK